MYTLIQYSKKEDETYMDTIGEKIRSIRKKAKLTQAEFGERLTVSGSYISMVEAGKEIPSDMLIRLISLEFEEPESGQILPELQSDEPSCIPPVLSGKRITDVVNYGVQMRRELAEQIVNDCYDNDLINTADYTNPATALKAFTDILLHRLEDYKLIRGEVF